ncbi:MAG: hypothetical protein HY905_20920 [Deltaproteobacteria bacterium]|nr:hypothetical protein [Deltaproteobacteria bacterium]
MERSAGEVERPRCADARPRRLAATGNLLRGTSPSHRSPSPALLCVLGLLSCSGHQISSWSPSGSLVWEEPPEAGEPDGDEEPAVDAEGPGEAGGGDVASDAGAPAVDDPAAALARADRHFAAGDMTPALQAYGVVFATGSPYEQSWALYRIAWCAVNLEQLDQAVGRMEQLLRMLGAPSDERARLLRRDAVHDLALFESMRGEVPAAQAVERLESVLQGEERETALRTLADQYRAAGRLDDETIVRTRLTPP